MASLTRPQAHRVVAGVCAGLGRRFGIDANFVRLAICVLALARGLGVAIYLALWLALPPDGATERSASSRLRSSAREAGDWIGHTLERARDAWADRGSVRPLGIVLIVAGLFALLGAVGMYSWVGPVGWLAIAAIVVGGGLAFAPRR